MFASVELLAEYIQTTIDPDSLIATMALRGATTAIQRYCDQTLSLVTDDEVVLDGSGTDVMLLPEIPVISVKEVIEDCDHDDTLELADDEGSSSDFAWTEHGLLIRRLGRVWPNRRQCVQVTYTHGYEEIPEDIQLITVAMAARAYAQDGATNESVGSYTAAYAGQPGSLTADEKRVLDRYRCRRR